jgi:SAM-dependent methyltransferase
LVLRAFDILYHNVALYWLASTVPFAGRWRVWQRLVLPRLQGHDVLEVGCGPGWLLNDMIAAGYHCQAIDASPQMVTAARNTLRRHATADGSTIVKQAQAQQLPFADAAFDSVVSTFPAPYIGDVATMREIARVLRPGGRLIVVAGANLLPCGPLLWGLVQIARMVYGRSDIIHPPGETELQALLKYMPMTAAGLTPAYEAVSGSCWRAYIAIGTKS